MKKYLCLIVLLLNAVAFGQKSEDDRAMNRPVEPFRIIGNIYYVGASDITSFLITTPAGHILIDAGYEETVPQIKANFAKLGFKLEDVKILLLNHAHYDHCGGLAELKRLTGARVYVSPPDAPVVEDGGISDFRFGGGERLFEPVKVDEILADKQKISLGGTTLETHFTFGHTKGATSWTTTVSDGGKSYSVLFMSSITMLDYKFIGNEKYPQIADDFSRTFKRLKAMKPQVFLGAHGQFFDLLEKAERLRAGVSPNPFIESRSFRRFVNAVSKNFEKRLAAEKKSLRKKP